MKKSHYIKTGAASLAIYFGIAVAAIGAHGMAHASDYEPLKPITIDTPSAPIANSAIEETKLLSSANSDYMKDSYKDFQVKLIGPLSLTIDDNLVQQRFTNLDTQRAQSVRSPFEAGTLTAPHYYRSTIAKTGFKIKF